MNSDTYCTMPWTHLHVGVNGQVHLCCVSKPIGSISKNSLEELWNGNTLKRVRTQMLSNEKPNECLTCFYQEDKFQGNSFRKEITTEFNQYVDPIKETDPDGTVADMKLLYIDFRFNNLCNFKCRSCSPIYSSSIGSELASANKSKTMKIVKNYGPTLYEEIKKQYNNVKKIYFAGGEPVMQPEHFQVLKDLIELGKASEVILVYITNGSKFKTSMGNMFDYWKHFKKVEIIFSIDGYKNPAEYWRSGTDWEEVESNIRTSNDPMYNIGTHIHSVVGWPNIFNWIEFIKYAIDTQLIDNLSSCIKVTLLENPICYSLSVVPEFKKKAICNELNKLKEYVLNHIAVTQYKGDTKLLNGIDMLISSLYTPARIGNNILNKDEFVSKNTKLDIWRGEDFFTAFPEHEDMRPYIT